MLLKNASIDKKGFRAASFAAGHRPGPPSTAKNQEVLHKPGTWFARVLLAPVFTGCAVENRVIGSEFFLFRQQITESLEHLGVMKITVSWV